MSGPERGGIGLLAFAAWLNLRPDKVPAEYSYHTCQATKDAWDRVAAAAREAALREAAERIGRLAVDDPKVALALGYAVAVCEAMIDGEKP